MASHIYRSTIAVGVAISCVNMGAKIAETRRDPDKMLWEKHKEVNEEIYKASKSYESKLEEKIARIEALENERDSQKREVSSLRGALHHPQKACFGLVFQSGEDEKEEEESMPKP